MKHANAYVVQLIALYQLVLAEYIKANKDTLDEIQAPMKDTVLRNAIVWSNASNGAVGQEKLSGGDWN